MLGLKELEIVTFSKKLRAAADALDALFETSTLDDAALHIQTALRTHKGKKRGPYRKTTKRSHHKLVVGGKTRNTVSERVTRRKRSAKFLAQFDTEIPKTKEEIKTNGLKGFGSYMRRGYLRRKNDGYVRTGKVFVV